MKTTLRYFAQITLLALALVLIWAAIIHYFALPHYLLPPPFSVGKTLIEQWPLLLLHSKITLIEIILGLVIGFLLGLLSALVLCLFPRLAKLLLPLLVLSQAIPVFAIAPLLVLWFGYGMPSKIVMTVLIIYFPVTATCYDGLRQTPKQWLELASTLTPSSWRILFKVRLPAALPALASGLRIATSIAPIGAIVGEWVGSSQGLGYLMLQANARMQVSLMFAALLMLMLMALTLYFTLDKLLNRLIPWANYLP
ncbi:ABC transporter permease [Volucribacter amazonae]|uniref:ABC transporter permease n=1 Tax=Volucribacter amazonae TaxID=256731 RepID=A0A9X4PCF0_9PAST|nr:ABC transporter permease [Volucribacter amazonae]MDG6894801.1 ABC transporter permease [Volucribacter amazonae]